MVDTAQACLVELLTLVLELSLLQKVVMEDLASLAALQMLLLELKHLSKAMAGMAEVSLDQQQMLVSRGL